MEDYGTAIFTTGFDITCIYCAYEIYETLDYMNEYPAEDPTSAFYELFGKIVLYPLFFCFAGIPIGLRIVSMSQSLKVGNAVKERNMKIEDKTIDLFKVEKDYTEVSKDFIFAGIISFSIGLFFRLLPVFLSGNEFIYKIGLFDTTGAIFIASGVAYKKQAKHIAKYLSSEKKALIPSLTVCPMIRPDCSGVMLVSRF